MYSKSFMQFLMGIDKKELEEEKNTPTIQELAFKSVKVQQAAKVVIASIKDIY